MLSAVCRNHQHAIGFLEIWLPSQRSGLESCRCSVNRVCACLVLHHRGPGQTADLCHIFVDTGSAIIGTDEHTTVSLFVAVRWACARNVDSTKFAARSEQLIIPASVAALVQACLLSDLNRRCSLPPPPPHPQHPHTHPLRTADPAKDFDDICCPPITEPLKIFAYVCDNSYNLVI